MRDSALVSCMGKSSMKNAESLEQELFDEYGPYVPLSRIWRKLSFPSLDAARKAAVRGTSPVICLTLPGRRGWYLHAGDVARWISDARRSPSEHKRLEAPEQIHAHQEEPMT